MVTSAPHPLLRIEGVCKAFESREVLGSVTFDMQPRELVVLLGPNGCGKTTLLRIIARLVKADKGAILSGSNGARSHSISVGLLFQRTLLLPWLSVEQNIRLPLKFSGAALDDESRSRLDLLIKTSELSDVRDCLPGSLSGGQRRKVAIVRSLLIPPDLLLMDEPFSELDFKTHRALQEYLLTIKEQLGTTILFVTHDAVEAAFLADRIVILSDPPSVVRKVIPVPIPRPLRTYESAGSEFKTLIVSILEDLRT